MRKVNKISSDIIILLKWDSWLCFLFSLSVFFLKMAHSLRLSLSCFFLGLLNYESSYKVNNDNRRIFHFNAQFNLHKHCMYCLEAIYTKMPDFFYYYFSSIFLMNSICSGNYMIALDFRVYMI